MNVPEKHRAIAHAWVDGAEIEYRGEGCFSDWDQCTLPAWSASFEYRIKPKPKVKKWRYWYSSTAEYYTEEDARAACFGPKVDGSMIEVDEE